MIVSITGTPGSGKTYIAKKLVAKDKKKYVYLDLNKIIKEEKLYESYDRKLKTYIVDTKKLKKIEKRFLEYKTKKTRERILKIPKKILTFTELDEILKKIDKSLIIDSHLSQYVYSDLCIVVKTNIEVLNKRLKARKYSKQKIKDNIESEIFDACLEDARALKRNIVVVNN